MKKGFYWHVHHDILFEWCYDYDERVEYIKTRKPKHEVETRLRLFQPIKSKLPKELAEAWEKFCEAREKYDEVRENEAWEKFCEARKKYGEAGKKFCEALLKYKPFLEALHAQECGCREWNGKELIFK